MADDVSIRIGAKADEAGINAAGAKLARSIELAVRQVSKVGTAGAKAVEAQLADIRKAFDGGLVSEKDAAGLASGLIKAAKQARGGANAVLQFSKAIATATANSQKLAGVLDKARSVEISINAKGLDSLEKIANKTAIAQQAQGLGDAIHAMAQEAASALPQSAGLIDELAKLQGMLAGGKLDGDTFRRMGGQIKTVAAEMLKLDNAALRRLGPHIHNVAAAFKGLNPPKEASGAIDEIARAIGDISPQAQRASVSIMTWARHLKGVGSLLARFPGMAALIGAAIAGIVAIFGKWKTAMQEGREALAQMNVDAFAQSIKTITDRLENQNKARERSLALQRAEIENLHTMEAAQRAIAQSQSEAQRNQRLAGAVSDAERYEANREAQSRERENEHAAAVAELNREWESGKAEMDANKDRMAANEKASADIRRKINGVQDLVQSLRRQGDNALKAEGFGANVKAWLGEAFATKMDGAKADEMLGELERHIADAVKERRRLAEENRELENRNKVIQAGRETWNERFTAATFKKWEGDEAAKREDAERMRGVRAENQGRDWELYDRERQRARDGAEQRRAMDEATGGDAAKLRNAEERVAEASADLAKAREKLASAEAAEARRLGVSSLADTDEAKLSDDFKRKRARYEGQVERGMANLRNAQLAQFNIGRDVTERRRRQRWADADRAYAEAVAQNEQRRSMSEAMGGAAIAERNARERVAEAQRRLDELTGRKGEIDREELARINATRPKGGKLKSLKGVADDDLSNAYRERREALRGEIAGARQGLRNALAGQFQAEVAKSERAAEFMRGATGGNRLTAMGLAGDGIASAWGRQTAENTRRLVDRMGELLKVTQHNGEGLRGTDGAPRYGY